MCKSAHRHRSQQYVRCTNTLHFEDVKACVVASAPKAAYLPSGIFVYEGSSVCKPATFMMVYVAFSYVLDLLVLAGLTWKNKKLWHIPYPQHGFSLYRLLIHLVWHVAEPFIMAAIVSGQAYQGSAITELVLFLMTPRTAPVVALLCAFLPGWRAFGAQQLLIDVIFAFITIFGWGLVPGTAIETWHADAGAPRDLVGAYNIGIQLSIMPNWLAISLVSIAATLWVFFAPKGKRSEALGHIIGIAIFVALLLASLPFFAIYEFVYGWIDRRQQHKEHEMRQQSIKASGYDLGVRNSNESLPKEQQLSKLAKLVPSYFRSTDPDTPPPKPHLGYLKSLFRRYFPDNGDSRPWKRSIGYGILLVSSFCITIGNWMATVTLLNIAGEVFCPSNIWALVLAKFGISLSKFILDFIHVP
jgi:hypothetical protein